MGKVMLRRVCICLMAMIWLATSFSVQAKQVNSVEVQSAVKKAVEKSNIPIVLPYQLPVNEKKFLTAKTVSNQNHYEVTYYEFTKQYKVNASYLNNQKMKNKLLKITATKYSTKKRAYDHVINTFILNKEGQKKHITDKIVGYTDAGAGSSWLTFEKGNWTVVIHSKTANSSKSIKLARQIIEMNNFHKPLIQGIIHLSVERNEGFIKWQAGNTVYKIDSVSSNKGLLNAITPYK